MDRTTIKALILTGMLFFWILSFGSFITFELIDWEFHTNILFGSYRNLLFFNSVFWIFLGLSIALIIIFWIFALKNDLKTRNLKNVDN